MKTGPQWEVWHDAFRYKHGRDPFFEEFVCAVQADALGKLEPEPLTEEEIAALADRYQKPAPEPLR